MNKFQRLTGPLAWTLNARVERTWQEARFPDYLDVSDWRKHRAIADGHVVETIAGRRAQR